MYLVSYCASYGLCMAKNFMKVVIMFKMSSNHDRSSNNWHKYSSYDPIYMYIVDKK